MLHRNCHDGGTSAYDWGVVSRHSTVVKETATHVRPGRGRNARQSTKSACIRRLIRRKGTLVAKILPSHFHTGSKGAQVRSSRHGFSGVKTEMIPEADKLACCVCIAKYVVA